MAILKFHWILAPGSHPGDPEIGSQNVISGLSSQLFFGDEKERVAWYPIQPDSFRGTIYHRINRIAPTVTE
ncbi:hypothetical protein SK128_016084 [Halocaridina rubra]|uniref:Uncharacterized protein n=1 Tax=Halocaridina rubra TaxID=373956 RepID=A0AAN9AH69_HALRR